MIMSRTADSVTCLVRRLEGSERSDRCDHCVRRHNRCDPACSMNMAPADRWAPAPCFYTFAGRAPVEGVWRCSPDDQDWGVGSIGVETWTRVRRRAGPPTFGRQLPAV
jgi:hypothetical protein